MKQLLPIAVGSLFLVAPRSFTQGTITMASYGTYSSGQMWSAPIFNTDKVTPLTSPYEVALYVGG